MKGEKKEKEREKKTRQGRQGTYTEGTATLFPSPPLLYEHRETHIHTEPQNTQKVWSHTEPGREDEGG